MTHEARRDELVDLALGLLEPDAARALEAHAGSCPTCRAELAALQKTRALLAGLPAVEAPARGTGELLAAARQAAGSAEAARRPGWAVPRWLAGGALGLAGAAALAVLVLRVPAPTAPLGDGDPRPVPQAAREKSAVPGEAPAVSAPPAPLAARKEEARDEQARPARAAAVALERRTGVADTSASAPPAAPAPVPAARPAPALAATPAAAPAADRKAAPLPEAVDEPRAAGVEPRSAEAAPPAAARAGTTTPLAAMAAARDGGGAGVEAAPCRLEQRRRFRNDAAGQVIARLREGRYPADHGDVPLTVEEQYGSDGRLVGATVRAGDRLITVSEADVAGGRVEPLPGVVLAATAAEAQRTPPRCEP